MNRQQRKQVRELYKIIHAYCNRRHFIDDIGYFCTVSGGIAMFWEDGDNFLDLIKYADNALKPVNTAERISVHSFHMS